MGMGTGAIKGVNYTLTKVIYDLEQIEKRVPEVSRVINDLARIRLERQQDPNQLDFLTKSIPVVRHASSN